MKHYFLPALAATTLLLGAGGCSVGDPDADDLLQPDQSILVSNSDDHEDDYASNFDESESEDSPLNKYLLTRVGYYNNYNVEFSYSTTGRPLSYSKSTDNGGIFQINKPQSNIGVYFDYDQAADNTPSTIRWEGVGYSANYYNCYNNGSLTDIQWENGHMTAATYTNTITYNDEDGKEQSKTENLDVTFTYDAQSHLTRIGLRDNTDLLIDSKFTYYDQTWDNNGNLTAANIPGYGSFTYSYYDIANAYAQWDPSLPFMGPMQYFGWFGRPSHNWTKSVAYQLEADPISGTDAFSGTIDLDYRINYDNYGYTGAGLIDYIRVSKSLNDYTEYSCSYTTR